MNTVYNEALVKCFYGCRSTIIMIYPSKMTYEHAKRALLIQSYSCETCGTVAGCDIPGHRLVCRNHRHMESFEVEFSDTLLQRLALQQKK